MALRPVRLVNFAVLLFALLLCVLTSFALSANSTTQPIKSKSAKAAPVKAEPMVHLSRPGRRLQNGSSSDDINPSKWDGKRGPNGSAPPREHRMRRAHTWGGDLRSLPQTPQAQLERPEREAPAPTPGMAPGTDSGVTEEE